MMKSKRYHALFMLLWSISLCMPSYGASKERDPFPLGCHDVGYQHALKVLTLHPEQAGERNSMYFVFNRLRQPVNLYHMHDEAQHFNLHMNYRIEGNKWSVFSTNEPTVKFICTIHQQDMPYGKIINCGDALSVCEYTKVIFGLNNRGNAWIVHNTTKNGAVKGVVRYGIIPAY